MTECPRRVRGFRCCGLDMETGLGVLYATPRNCEWGGNGSDVVFTQLLKLGRNEMGRRALYGYPASSTERSRRCRERKRYQLMREGKLPIKKRRLVPGYEPPFHRRRHQAALHLARLTASACSPGCRHHRATRCPTTRSGRDRARRRVPAVLR